MHQATIPTVTKAPQGMATLNQLLGRRLVRSSKQEAVARLRFAAPHKEWSLEEQAWVRSSVERTVDLYEISAARPMTSALQRAEMEYYDLFVQDASKDSHIVFGAGQPVMIGGHPYFDADGHQVWDDGRWAVDENGEYLLDLQGNLLVGETPRVLEGWSCRIGPISRSTIKQHINGNEIFGVYGGKHSRFFVIDLDLHAGDPDVYKHRLNVLIPLLWGKFQTSFSVSQGGVHIVGVFPKRLELERLRGELTRCLRHHVGHDSHFFVGEKLVIELFPSQSHPIRLPLARGRITYCDGILPARGLSSGRDVPDVCEFIKWIKSSSKPATSPEYVINLAINTAKPRSTQDKCAINKQSSKFSIAKASPAFPAQRGKFLQNLVCFWTGKMPYSPGLLNNMLVMSTRLLIHSGHSDDSIINILSYLSNILKETGFPSNTLNDPARLRFNFFQKIRECRDNSNQPDPGLSTAKMRGVAEYCRRIGFSLADPSTCHAIDNTNNNLYTSIIWEPNLDEQDKVVIREKIYPILKSNPLSCEYSIRRFLGWFGKDCRQVSAKKLLPKLLEGTGVKMGNYAKQRRFLKAMVREGFIELVRESSPPSARGVARTYSLTQKMKEKLVPINSKGMNNDDRRGNI
jgi:hypothetical protein